jgi:ubiquinol-cytochrome c reductase iron-sulfur subunit
MAETAGAGVHGEGEESRRDFLYIATGVVAGLGTLAAMWPLIDQANPSRDVLALATTDVDISKVEVGQSITVMWRSRPVFVRHRTPAEIKAARDVDVASLPDPEPDSAREIKPEWLVVIGVCTHLGCIPLGNAGKYGGWYCPCHGSVYDTSGRIRSGPAPKNLVVPPYAFLNDTTIRIG